MTLEQRRQQKSSRPHAKVMFSCSLCVVLTSKWFPVDSGTLSYSVHLVIGSTAAASSSASNLDTLALAAAVSPRHNGDVSMLWSVCLRG